MTKNEIKCETPGETPELCEQDSKEYDNLNGYYINISYSDDLFSILVYNMELLDEKKYEIEIELNDLLKKHDIMKQLRNMQKIFDFFNDLIEKNNFSIIQEDKFIKFFFYLGSKNSNEKNDKIGFLLKLDKKKDKSEYIKFLCKSIRKSRSKNIEQEQSKLKIESLESDKKLLNESINKEDNSKEIKLIELNCDKCPLIPSFQLDTKKTIKTINSRCSNGHLNKNIELLSYLEKAKKFSKYNYKCNCQKSDTDTNSTDLFYCEKCQILFCKMCSGEKHSEHRSIPEESMNYYCIQHMKQFSSFCKKCQKNFCSDCEEHKAHDIYHFDDLIIFQEDFDKIIKKSESINNRLKECIDLIDIYEKEFIEKINKLKNLYQTEMNLINDFISKYSKCLHDYIFCFQVIQNLDNIENFSFDEEKIIKTEDSFYEKTKKLINIFKEYDNVDSDKNFKLIKSFQRKETIYSMCYSKKYNYIFFGKEKKIEILNSDLDLITSFKELDDKIAYIKELWDDKFLVVDLHKNIKILELKDNKVTLFKSIETKDEKNFVGTGTCTKNIIVGGDQYLSIIGKTLLLGFKMIQSFDLGGFISNIVEIDSNSFLVGQSHQKRIIIYSNKTFKELYRINDIALRGNNYSISKLTDKFVGITGFEKMEARKACIFLLSIETKQICKKFYSNNIESFSVIIKLNENEFIVGGVEFEKDEHSDLIAFSLENKSNKVNFKILTEFKRAVCDTFEALMGFNNTIIVSDSSSNLKVFEIK